MKAIDPEDRVVGTVTDTVNPAVFWKLVHSAEPERAEGCVIERAGTPNVGNAYSGHLALFRSVTPLVGILVHRRK